MVRWLWNLGPDGALGDSSLVDNGGHESLVQSCGDEVWPGVL